jgi:integrase
MPTHFDAYEKWAKQLEQIAKILDKKSAKHAALELAGWALAFATMHHHHEFQKFLDSHRGKLSSAETARLNKLGLKWQSAKRQKAPDVLTAEEIMAFLKELPDPLRTMIELDAFTGLRRGELIGLRWQDVDFANLVLHIRRSVVAMVEGAPKTEASLKDVPLDAQTAESLWAWKHVSPYGNPGDWLFAFPHMKGRQPYWPGTLWRYYGKPALERARVTKQVSYHTFRHTFGTLLNANGENPKVVQELLRHASLRVTTDVYMQAVGAQKREAQSNLVKLVRRGAVSEINPA